MPARTEPDRVIAGRYRLASVLGHGGMGTVWRAVDELLGRQVAVKEVSPPSDVTSDEGRTLRERTLHEARTAARLSHPNVVRVYDIVEDGSRPWIVMELVDARPLSDIVDRDGPLTPQRAAAIGVQLLSALRAAHDIGIVHRDVKPGNVLIDGDRAVLADFGIARALDSPSVTRSGVLVGSPAYTAPERARGGRGGPESDLWSLGATLYAAVEGRPPYQRDSVLGTLSAVASAEPDPPLRAGPLWPLLARLLSRDPAERPGAADAELMLRHAADPDSAERIGDPAAGDMPDARIQDSDAGPGAAGVPGGEAGGLAAAERTRVLRQPRGEAGELLAGAGLAGGGPAGQPGGRLAGAGLAGGGPARQPGGLLAGAGLAGGRPARQPGGPPAVGTSGRWPGQGRAGEARRSGPPAAGTPAQPATGRAGPRARRWPALLAVAVGAAVLAGAWAVASTLRPGATAQGAHGPGGASHQAGRHGGTRPASPQPSGPTPGAGRGQTDPAGRDRLPPGYRRYRDPTGFSIGVPGGWTVSHRGHVVYITPPSGAMFLLIDQTTHPRPDPLADWRQQEAARRSTYPDYHLIRLRAVRYPQAEKAADWEFSYTGSDGRVRVLNRNVLANAGHAYALYWSVPAGLWRAGYQYFTAFAATFRPAPAPAR